MARSPARRGRRLFFALWPSDEFREAIQVATLAIARARGGRLIPARNFHVTLLFLGEMPEERFADIQQAGARLAGNCTFELNFDGIETWGRKVLCLTTSAPPAAALDLAERLRVSLSAHLPRQDEREYRPHISLARDLPRGGPAQKIRTLCLKATDFVLVESVPGAAGSQYSVLERWPLRGPGT